MELQQKFESFQGGFRHLDLTVLIEEMPPKSVATSTPKLASQETSSAPSNAFQTLWNAYQKQTPTRLKLIDSYLVFIMLSGIIQFVYCIGLTNFPFNAFLAGYGLKSLFTFCHADGGPW
jgi:hypothetical protein